MKKSTLITTIAMIVVVVVALSTATYAWFNSATATQVSASITTQSQSGWLVYAGSSTARTEAGVNSIAYDPSATLSGSLHLMNGLFSPSDELTGTLTNDLSDETLATYSSDIKFFTALQNGQGVQETATLEAAGDNKYTHTVSENEVDNTSYLRIVNNNSAPADCIVTILVYVDNSNGNAKRAAKEFNTYFCTSGNVIANTDYYYGTVSDTTATIHKSAAETPAIEKVPKTNNVTYVDVNGVNPKDDGVNSFAVVSEGKKRTFGTGDTMVTLSAGTAFYTMTITLASNLQPRTAINTVFYAWLDGWALDSNAAGAPVSVSYCFGSTATEVTAEVTA